MAAGPSLHRLLEGDHGFRRRRLLLHSDSRLEAHFEAEAGDGWVVITLLERDTKERVFQRLSRCAVKYRGHLGSDSAERRHGLASLVTDFAGAMDAELSRGAGRTMPEVLGRRPAPAEPLLFDRDALIALLNPDLGLGQPVAGGWVLHGIEPRVPHGRGHAEVGLALELRRVDAAPLTVLVDKRRGARGAYATSAHLAIRYAVQEGPEAPGTEAAVSRIAFVLQVRDHEAVQFIFPETRSDSPGALTSAERIAGWGPEYEGEGIATLALCSDCEQACSFCTVKDASPPVADTDALWATVREDMAAHRSAGATELRLNGYDPLAYPRVLEVLDHARDLGYGRVEIHSPCTRLADRAFADHLVARLPKSRRVIVPLYGATAATHDQVVGRPGAHAAVLAALDHLLALLEPHELHLTSVVTKRNLGELAALRAYARGLGVRLHVQVPYVHSESRHDRYVADAPTQRAIAEALAALYGEDEHVEAFHVAGTMPCVTFEAMTRAGVSTRRWLLVPTEPPSLPGTPPRTGPVDAPLAPRALYAPTVPCPHLERCVLADACPGQMYQAYAQAHGMDELHPVSLADLVAAGDDR